MLHNKSPNKYGHFNILIRAFILSIWQLHLFPPLYFLRLIPTNPHKHWFLSVSPIITPAFEPGATSLEKEGHGYVVASLGVDSGYVPYTAYSAKGSYIEKNPEIIQKFTNALQKGMDYVNSHSAEEIAEVMQSQFKETDLDTLTTIVKRYHDQETWKDNLVFEEKSFDLLQDILESSGELDERTPYSDLVTTKFAEKVAK